MNSARFIIQRTNIHRPIRVPCRNKFDSYDGKRWIEKRRMILDAHKDKRLKLATELGDGPARYKFKEEPQKEVIIKKEERTLASLAETALPYSKYDDHEPMKKTIFYDPLFNPHLHEERNRVNPQEEPFNAIYNDSKETEGGSQYTDVKDVTTPELWKLIEGLDRIRIAPEVPRRKKGEPIKRMPSGFIPPPEEAPELPYFIARTRNHLLPVYYNLSSDEDNCFTLVKNISGDIWKLEEDLRKDLNLSGLSSVSEPSQQISFKGRHLKEIVDWLHERGF